MKNIIVAIIGFMVFLNHAFAETITPAEKYQSGQRVRVLLVPGHDNEFSGASFRGVREADMTESVTRLIADILKQDSMIEVVTTRDGNSYTPDFENYFSQEARSIKNFIERHSRETQAAISRGDIEVREQVPHANASSDVVTRLYGINKWANEHDIDMIIHVHFNDFWPRSLSQPGDYYGYTVYVPDSQLPNAEMTIPIATTIAERLASIFPRSSLPSERKQSNDLGIAPDLKLIALGANRTLGVPSLLIEYGYIYEAQMTNPFFEIARNAYARATALGVKEYLRGSKIVAPVVRYHFDVDLASSQSQKMDALALQLSLAELGLYPPKGKTSQECPFTGRFGSCTTASVKDFQKKFFLDQDGLFGKKSRAALNGLFTVPVGNE